MRQRDVSAPDFVSGRRVADLEVKLRTVTPVVGGGARARHVDPWDPFRGPAIKGHLRQWWRAIYGPRILAAARGRAPDLYREESALWGSVAGDGGSASLVAIDVELGRNQTLKVVGGKSQTTPDGRGVVEDIQLNSREGYALFAARAQVEKLRGEVVRIRESPAQRIQPEVAFTLRVRVSRLASEEQRRQTRAALQAWILFGGVGGRTRRGCGSLAVEVPGSVEWLPTLAEVSGALDDQIAAAFPGLSAGLKGAAWLTGPPGKAMEAWMTAISWLKDFRQGAAGDARRDRAHAREVGRAPKPAGRSNWPEPDKLRQLGIVSDHRPVRPGISNVPAWPRAAFGLPIGMEFESAGGGRKTALQLVLSRGDRLASALILKPLQTRTGFVPLALWLSRALPAGTQVIVAAERQATGAPFGLVRAAGDSDYFDALAGKASVQEAFFDWLTKRGGAARGSL